MPKDLRDCAVYSVCMVEKSVLLCEDFRIFFVGFVSMRAMAKQLSIDYNKNSHMA